MSYRERLARNNDAYRNAQPPGSSNLPPDGEYQCQVNRFDFLESKKNGRLYLKTEMSVAIGPQRGWPVDALHDLEDPERLKYLKAHLLALGVEIETLDELENALHSAVDAIVLVEVWTSDKLDAHGAPFRNATVRQRLAGMASLGDIPTEPVSVAASDDGIPF